MSYFSKINAIFKGSLFENSKGEYIIGMCTRNDDGLPEWQWAEEMDGHFNFANVSLPACGKHMFGFLIRVPVIKIGFALFIY